MASKSHRRRVIKSDVLVVGVDVAKRRHVAVCRRPDGIKLKSFSFSNDRAGFGSLVRRAESSERSARCKSVVFALEATGHYGHALRHYLADRGYAVVGINPAHTKKAKELEDNSPEKSDSKDAGVIADLAAQGRGRAVMLPRGVYAELRRLGKLRQRLTIERTRVVNQYHALVDLLFPELVGIVRNVACRSILRLMAQAPAASDVADLDYDELQDRLWRWSRGHIGVERIGQIYRAARDSVGLRDGLETARLEMSQTLELLHSVERRMAEVERVQKISLGQVSYARFLLSVPHLGAVTIATILGETGDLRLYRNAEAVIKLAGYNLFTISSGESRGRTRITKRGRPLLRHHLFLASLRLSKNGAPLGGFRERFAGRKAGPKVAVAGCRKLLRLLIALVRDERMYEPGRLGVKTPDRAVA